MRGGVSNHRRIDGLHNRLFGLRSKKTSKLRVTGLCEGNSPPVNSPHKDPVTRKLFPFDDGIMMEMELRYPHRLRVEEMLKMQAYFVFLKRKSAVAPFTNMN